MYGVILCFATFVAQIVVVFLLIFIFYFETHLPPPLCSLAYQKKAGLFDLCRSFIRASFICV